MNPASAYTITIDITFGGEGYPAYQRGYGELRDSLRFDVEVGRLAPSKRRSARGSSSPSKDSAKTNPRTG